MNANFEVQLHNSCVSHVLNNMTALPNSGDEQSFSIQQVTNYFNAFEWTVPNLIYPDFPSDLSNIDLDLFLQSWLTKASVSMSPELATYSSSLISLLSSSSTLKQFYDNSRNLVEGAESSLSANDLQILADATHVANSSLSFWVGQNEGVYTWTAGLIVDPPPPPALAAINWWKVAGTDLVGGISGAIIAGSSSGGLGTGAGALLGAATTSTISIIHQW